MSRTTSNPAVRKVVFSSASDDWPTPQHIYDELDAEFGFVLDPCASTTNHKAPLYYAKDHPDPARQDGLEGDWAADALAVGGAVYVNSPYGRGIDQWMTKAAETARRGVTVVCLVPSRTDARWFQRLLADADEVRFLAGRLKFGDAMNAAPFGSAVVIFRGTTDRPAPAGPACGCPTARTRPTRRASVRPGPARPTGPTQRGPRPTRPAAVARSRPRTAAPVPVPVTVPANSAERVDLVSPACQIDSASNRCSSAEREQAEPAMTTRGRATGRPVPSEPKPAGYRGFTTALEARLVTALRQRYAPGAPLDAESRLLTAARVVADQGMPARHAAARQLLVGYLGVYDRFLGPPPGARLDPDPALLAWQLTEGVVVDVPRAVTGNQPLLDTGALHRLDTARRWAAGAGRPLLGVRVLAMGAPATSLLATPDGEFVSLAGTTFVGGLLAGVSVPAARTAVSA